MKRITMTGKNLKTYSGADTVDGKMIALRIYPGMTVSVTDEKAERMLRDYPKDFVEGESAGKKAPEPTTTASSEAKVTFEPKEETGKKPKKNKAATPKKNKKG